MGTINAIGSLSSSRGKSVTPHNERYRTIYTGAGVTVPSHFLGIATLFWPVAHTASPPTYQFGHMRTVNVVAPNSTTITQKKAWSVIEPVQGTVDYSFMDATHTSMIAKGSVKSVYTWFYNPEWAATGPYRNAALFSGTLSYGRGAIAALSATGKTGLRRHIRDFLLRYNVVSSYNTGGVVLCAGIQVHNEPSLLARTVQVQVTGATGSYANGTITTTSAGLDGDNGATATSTSLSGTTLTINTLNGAFGRSATISGNTGAWTATITNTEASVKLTGGYNSAAEMADFTRYVRLGRDDAVAIGGSACNVPIIAPSFTVTTLSDGTAASYYAATDDNGDLPVVNLGVAAANNYNFGSELMTTDIGGNFGYGGAATPQGNRTRHNAAGASTLPAYSGETGYSAFTWASNQTMSCRECCRVIVQHAALGYWGMQVYSYDQGFWTVNADTEELLSQVHGLVAGRTIIKLEENMRSLQLRITYLDNSVVYF